MPYTKVGRWQPLEWFEENGVDVPADYDAADEQLRVVRRSFRDPTDEELVAAWQDYYGLMQTRRQQEAEVQAENDRLMELERLRIEAEELEAQHRRAEEDARLAITAEESGIVLQPGDTPAFLAIRLAFNESLFTAHAEPVYRLHDDTPVPQVNSRREGAVIAVTAPVTGYTMVVNSRSNEVLSIKSDEYEIIQDEDVLRRYMAIFEGAQVEVRPVRHHATRGKDGIVGRTTYMELELPAHALQEPQSLLPSTCRIVITNSFDGSLKNRFYKMYWNTSTNQMMMGWGQQMAFAIKHRTGASERIIHELQRYLISSHQEEIAICRRLEITNGQTDSIMAYLNNNPILVGERNAERLTGIWMRMGTPTNMWAVYNVFRDAINNNYSPNFGSRVAKLEQLNREVRKNWGRVITLTNWTNQDIFHGITLGTEVADEIAF